MPTPREPARNINLSANDLQRLLMPAQYPAQKPMAGDPESILRTIKDTSAGNALAKQRQMERDSFGIAPANQNELNQQQPPGPNPIQAILAQLQKLMSGGGVQMPKFQPTSMPTFDPNKYKSLAESQVNAQFNPIIQQIMAQQGQTQQRAKTNQAAVGSLYTGAANQITADSAVSQKGFDQSQAQSKQLYTDERNRIAAGYAADAAAQRAQAKKLGTDMLGMGTESAIAQQNADKQFSDQMGSQQMQSSQNAFEQQQQAAGQYDKSIAQATRAEGIQGQQDIMGQLEQYMSQSNSDLANTRSQAAGSVTDLMQKLADASYNRDAQNTQFQYQQQRDYIGDSQNAQKLQQDALMAQLQAASSNQSQQQLNPWQQVAGFAEQVDPGQGSALIAAIQKAMNERGEIYARSKDDTPMNPALFAKLVADYPENANLDRNSLMQVSQVLYKLLYGMN